MSSILLVISIAMSVQYADMLGIRQHRGAAFKNRQVRSPLQPQHLPLWALKTSTITLTYTNRQDLMRLLRKQVSHQLLLYVRVSAGSCLVSEGHPSKIRWQVLELS